MELVEGIQFIVGLTVQEWDLRNAAEWKTEETMIIPQTQNLTISPVFKYTNYVTEPIASLTGLKTTAILQ
jgi:hypothetical protein